jgi:outer membrane protein OmpA-like peptidoglycan-associated protein
MTTYTRSTILLLAGFLGGCAASQAPEELVDARRAYAHASEGPGRQLVPAQLLSAEQALARAERAFTDSPDAASTRDLAYIAERRSEIADAQGTLAADIAEKTHAQAELAQLQAANQARTQVQLSETRAELASERMVLATKEQQLSAMENRLRSALSSLAKMAAVKEEARGLVITLNGSVLFETNQATLLPIAQDRLQEVAQALKDNPKGAVLIEGHTDSTGSASLNDDLSRRRAESVRTYLISQGLPADRIRAVGLGSQRPIADNKTPEGRANNRRVEIIIQRDQPSPAP